MGSPPRPWMKENTLSKKILLSANENNRKLFQACERVSRKLLYEKAFAFSNLSDFACFWISFDAVKWYLEKKRVICF